MISRLFLGAVCALGLIGAAGGAVAQSSVGAKVDWTIFVEEDPRQCWVVSPPQPGKSTATRSGRPVAVTRGDIFLIVAFWGDSGQGGKGEVSFLGGYDFAESAPVKIKIGDKSFELFTEGNTAWATSPEEDRRITAAMKAGANAVVTGLSKRSGTTTTDTFSLIGFTAAYEDAQNRCGG